MAEFKIIFTTIIMLVIVGCSGTQGVSNEVVLFEKIQKNDLKSGDVNVIFYRAEGNKNNVAVAKIGERVAGSILPNSYAHSKVCMDTIHPGVAQRGGKIAVTKYLQPIDVNDTECMFFKVNEANDGSFSLSRVSCDAGKKEIDTINRKSNIINRNLPDCKVSIGEKK
jgi:hypothetical protein